MDHLWIICGTFVEHMTNERGTFVEHGRVFCTLINCVHKTFDTIFCGTFVEHLWNTCQTSVEHLWSNCGTFVEHMPNECGTFVEHDRFHAVNHRSIRSVEPELCGTLWYDAMRWFSGML